MIVPRLPQSSLLAGLIGLLIAGAASCERDEQRERERTEAEQLLFAVTALREAEGDAKAPRLSALRALPCTAPEACELRDSCAQAYALHLRGVDGVRAVRHALDTDASAPELAAKALDQAEKDVVAARRETARCADLHGALVRRYR